MNYALRRKLRIRKFEEQQGCCIYCAGGMLLIHFVEGHPPPAFATLEHLTQRARGGPLTDENTKLACAACNNFRPDGMESEEYLMLRQRLLPLWPACTHPSRFIRRMLARLSRLNQGLAA